jgi:hypothetical protein
MRNTNTTPARYSKVTNTRQSNPFDDEESIEFNTPAIIPPTNTILGRNPFDESTTDDQSRPPTNTKQTSIRAFLNRNLTRKDYNPFDNEDTNSNVNPPSSSSAAGESSTVDEPGVEMTSVEYQRSVEKSKKKRNKFRQNLRTMGDQFHNDGSENQTDVCISNESENAIIRFLVAKRG